MENAVAPFGSLSIWRLVASTWACCVRSANITATLIHDGGVIIFDLLFFGSNATLSATSAASDHSPVAAGDHVGGPGTRAHFGFLIEIFHPTTTNGKY
jgi:hypothetical protein